MMSIREPLRDLVNKTVMVTNVNNVGDDFFWEYFLSHKMTINFYVFGLLMENWIWHHVYEFSIMLLLQEIKFTSIITLSKVGLLLSCTIHTKVTNDLELPSYWYINLWMVHFLCIEGCALQLSNHIDHSRSG